MNKRNIVLIGMPSSGKSTTALRISEITGMEYIDTDTLVSRKRNKTPKEIVNEDGLEFFLDVQEQAILELNVNNTVIATGGSVVYGTKAVEHLKTCSIVVFLKLEYGEIEKRLAPGRRFAKGSGQSLHDLYLERMPLYESFADITVDCTGKEADAIAAEIMERVQEYL